MKKTKKKKLAPIVLTERDKAIILSVYENRFLRRDQIQRLYFPNASVPACNMRLKKLYEHSFLDRLIRPVAVGSNQIVYALNHHGAVVVSATLNIDRHSINWKRDHNRVEFLFMEHTLAVAEFKVNLDLVLRKTDGVDWLFYSRESKGLQARVPDPAGKKKYLVVAPDAFFGLKISEGNSFFFLEVDMGTETLKRFGEKVTAYKQYWKTGKYRQDYEFNHFRVLTIAESKKRLSNLIDATRKNGGRNMFLFTTFAEIERSVFGSVWFSPEASSPSTLLNLTLFSLSNSDIKREHPT